MSLVRPVEQLRWAATTLVETVSQQLGGNAGSTSYTLGKLGIPTFVVTPHRARRRGRRR